MMTISHLLLSSATWILIAHHADTANKFRISISWQSLTLEHLNCKQGSLTPSTDNQSQPYLDILTSRCLYNIKVLSSVAFCRRSSKIKTLKMKIYSQALPSHCLCFFSAKPQTRVFYWYHFLHLFNTT